MGPGRPPIHTRFKKGQSGNPGGRKKGQLNFRTILAEVADTEIEVTDQMGRRSVPILKAMVLRLAKEGLSGNMKAISVFTNLCTAHLPSAEEAEDELTGEDHEVIARYVQREHPGTEDPTPDDNDGSDDDEIPRPGGPRSRR